MWPIAFAVILRAIVWQLVPDSRYASDEAGYVNAGVALAERGEQDLFWPPFTGWVVALITTVVPGASLRTMRAVWILLDLGCVAAIAVLARRTAAAVFGAESHAVRRVVTLSTLGYGVYLPAVSHAQFVTSETLALLLLLIVLVLMTAPRSVGTVSAGGAICGLLILTRASLLPLLVFWPALLLRTGVHLRAIRHAALFALVGAAPIAVVMALNYQSSGELTLSRNAAYNLYIGNQAMYAEDLNLFDPRATPDQIEFRRQYFANTLKYPTLSAPEMQRQAIAWIVDNPGTFARRALGRVARVFAPKTDVLELVGGEAASPIWSVSSISLLSVAAVQWAMVLIAGCFGLARIVRASPELGWLYAATVLGSLVLCAVAIAKPRYSFVFDPILILGAAVFACAPRDAVAQLTARDKSIIGVILAFVLWGWIAWLVFAVTSRTAI